MRAGAHEIPVQQDGAGGIPPALGVETCSAGSSSAPAALPLGSGRKPHKVSRHNRLIVAETYHDFGDDLPDQPGVIALVGVNGAVEAFQFIDFRSFHGAASSQREQEDNAARY